MSEFSDAVNRVKENPRTREKHMLHGDAAKLLRKIARAIGERADESTRKAETPIDAADLMDALTMLNGLAEQAGLRDQVVWGIEMLGKTVYVGPRFYREEEALAHQHNREFDACIKHVTSMVANSVNRGTVVVAREEPIRVDDVLGAQGPVNVMEQPEPGSIQIPDPGYDPNRGAIELKTEVGEPPLFLDELKKFLGVGTLPI